MFPVSSFLPVVAALLCFAPASRAAVQNPADVPPEHIIVREVVFEGLESYDEPGVLRTLGIEIGKPLPDLRPGVEQVWKVYRIFVLRQTVDFLPDGGLKLTIPVKELPVDLDPRFVGYDEVSLDTLHEWAGLFDREEIYLHEADRIKNRLVIAYRRKGFHHVEIDVVTGGPEGPEGTDAEANDVIFQIREGPKVRCTGLVVRGNDHLPDTGWGLWRGGLKTLAEVKTKGRGIFRWWGGVFVQEELDADLQAMSEVYRGRGYLDARVEIEDLDFNEARSRVKVYVRADEGQLWRVSSVDIVGVEIGPDGRAVETELIYPKEELLALCDLGPGIPYERGRLEHDEFEITGYYGERGHISSRDFAGQTSEHGFRFLQPDVVHDAEKREVGLVFRVLQGTQMRLREISVSGNSHTNDKVIRRQVSLLPGDLVDTRSIGRSLARVRSTGYFDDVRDPRHPPPRVIFHEIPGQPGLVDVEFAVEEGRVVDFQISGGVNSNSGVVGLVSLFMRNFQAGDLPSGFTSSFGEIFRKEAFHGNGEAFGVNLSPGSQVAFWSVEYSHPDIFGSHFNRIAARAEINARDRRYTSHDEDRKRGTLTFARLYAQGDFSLRVGGEWLEVDIDNLDEDEELPETLLESEGETTFQGPTVSLRMNKLDHRWVPRNGYFWEWGNAIYGGPFGGDNDVWKSEVTYDYFFELGDRSADIRPGFYIGAGAGVAYPYGDTEFTNYAERFFLGGSTTMRGFDFRGVGPNTGDVAIGGETVLSTSLEYRFPLYSTPVPGTSLRQEVFRGILFLEAGVLDPDAFRLDLDEYRASIGFGFGLAQPFPLTFNFGFPLREGPGDQIEVFSFVLSSR